MSEAEAGGGRRYVVLAVVFMLLAALTFSPLVSFRSSQHIDTESASLDSNLPTKDSDNDGLPDWWEMEFDLNPFDAADALLDTDQDGHDRNRNGILEEGEFFTNLMEFEIRRYFFLYTYLYGDFLPIFNVYNEFTMGKHISYDTNVTHHFETYLNKGFQRHSTIEWE